MVEIWELRMGLVRILHKKSVMLYSENIKAFDVVNYAIVMTMVD